VTSRGADRDADDLHWNCGGEILDQVCVVTPGHVGDQAIHQCDEAGLPLGNGTRRQRPDDGATHMGVQRQIVEDESRRVMLKQQGRAKFGRELDLLVRGKSPCILVDRLTVPIPRDEVDAVRHAVHRVVTAQHVIAGKRIIDEILGQMAQIAGSRHAGVESRGASGAGEHAGSIPQSLHGVE
jgi:hypothetical protein